MCKRAFGQKKAGHAGTLDPAASGVLPIALGEATKTIPYLTDDRKIYRFTIRFGHSTTTDDAEGEALETSRKRPSLAELQAILPHFTGRIMQMPPQVSALKIDGKRAYDLAREGQHVPLKPRPQHVSELTVETTQGEENALQSATLYCVCNKGTYMRSLARDIARMLGSQGHAGMIHRIASGVFHEKDAISLDFLQEIIHKQRPLDAATLQKAVREVTSGLADIPVLVLEAASAVAIRQGKMIPAPQQENAIDGALFQLHHAGILLALAKVTGAMLQPKRGFNLER